MKATTLARLRTLLALAMASTMLVASGCASLQRSPVTGKKRAYGYSWEKEIQIGKEYDASIVAQYGIYDDPELTAYVNRIGQQVLATSHLRPPKALPQYADIEFTFRVLDSPIVNAFALPGGFVYITRGLLAHCKNEAQLAVVIGHEIGHVAARHTSQRVFEQQLGQLATIGGAIAGEIFLGAGQNILQAGSAASQMLFLSYGREDERESDALGVEYAAEDGYTAADGSAFFTTLKRLSQKAGVNIPAWQSSHPDPGEREQTILKLAAEWEAKGVSMTKSNRDQLFAAIDGMVVGDNPREGFVENNTFYHPELKWQYPVPSKWKLINTKQAVQMIDDEQKAIMILQLAQGAQTAQQGAQKFQQDLSQNEGIRVTGSGATRVNGLTAHEMSLVAAGQQGNIIADVLFIEYGGIVYQWIAYTAESTYNTYRREFAATLEGFKPLTDRKIMAVQPTRLAIVKANGSKPFQTFVPGGRSTANLTPEDIAIINQVDLGQTISSGTALKLIK